MTTFLTKARELKARRGMTTADLSEKSGIPIGTLNKLLAGIVEDPKLSTAQAIAAALGTSLGALVGEGSDTPATDDERKLLHDYRASDNYGKALVRQVAEMESGRVADTGEWMDDRGIRVPQSLDEGAVIPLPLYLSPVSAGFGTHVENEPCEIINVRASYSSEQADFALRVTGKSMEPRFKDGDIILVHQQPTVQYGDLGVFIADDEGYFKRFMGDRLHSLNPEVPDIPLSSFISVLCCGKVVGHMKKKS